MPLELDFINEGHNAEMIARNFGSRDDIIVPRIVWEYSTRRVLVMEYLEGIKITDLAGLERAGINAQAVGAAGDRWVLRAALPARDVPRRPAPGEPRSCGLGPKLVMLDFGLCRQLDDKFRLGYARLVNAMLTWNIAGHGAGVPGPRREGEEPGGHEASTWSWGRGLRRSARRGGRTPTRTSSQRRTSGCRRRSGRTRSRTFRGSFC